MNTLQLKLSYNKSARLKTIILLFILMFCFFNLSAQEESNIKLKIEAGYLWTSKSENPVLNIFSGIFLHIEPKVKTSKNTVIGLRIGASINTQRFLHSNSIYIDNYQNEVFSFVPTFDYYFIKKNSRPYLGVGVGYNLLTTSKMGFVIGNSSEVFKISVNNQVGFLLRGGLDLPKFIIGRVDLSKFSVGLEFNYIPMVDAEISNGEVVGTLNNSNIALAIGYTIGLRKSSK